MKIVKGNKLLETGREEILELIKPYDRVVVDVGTGDGRYVYKKSLKEDKTFYIGVDPSHKQIETYSKKAVKNKINNTLYVLGSIEVYPEELYGIADAVVVLLPWGTLLQSIVKPIPENIRKLWLTLRNKGELSMVFGYSREVEQSEVMRLNLHNLDNEYIKENVIPELIDIGFESVTLNELGKEDLAQLESTWGKRLSFGQDRPIYNLKLQKNINQDK